MGNFMSGDEQTYTDENRPVTFSDLVESNQRMIETMLVQRKKEQREWEEERQAAEERARERRKERKRERERARENGSGSGSEREPIQDEDAQEPLKADDLEMPQILMRLSAPNQGTQQMIVRLPDGTIRFIKRIRIDRGQRAADALREVANTMRVAREAHASSHSRYLGIPRDMAFNGRDLEVQLDKGEMNLTAFIDLNCKEHPHIGELVIFILLQLARALLFVHGELSSVLGNLSPESIMVRGTSSVPTIFLSSLKRLVPAVPEKRLEKNFAYAVRTGQAPAGGPLDRDSMFAAFAAPEVVDNPGAFASQPGDVFSFGAVMLWLVTGQILSSDRADREQYLSDLRKLTEGDEADLAAYMNKALKLCASGLCDDRSDVGGARCMRMLQAMPPQASRLYVTLMRACLQSDPKLRPSAQALAGSALFNGVKHGGFESVAQMLDLVESTVFDEADNAEKLREKMLAQAAEAERLRAILRKNEELEDKTRRTLQTPAPFALAPYVDPFKPRSEKQEAKQEARTGTGTGSAGEALPSFETGGEEYEPNYETQEPVYGASEPIYDAGGPPAYQQLAYPMALRSGRNQIATNLHAQLMQAAPELTEPLTAAVVEGLAHADRMVVEANHKIPMAQYAANVLAGFDFALNVGSELSFDTRRKVLNRAATSLQRNAIKLSAADALDVQETMLYTRSPTMFADNEVLSACRSELNGAVLRSALDNPHSTLDFLRNKFKDVQG